MQLDIDWPLILYVRLDREAANCFLGGALDLRLGAGRVGWDALRGFSFLFLLTKGAMAARRKDTAFRPLEKALR